MATFTAAVGSGVDMTLFFRFADGFVPIDSLTIDNGDGRALARDDNDITLTYWAPAPSDFAASDLTTPSEGTFVTVDLAMGVSAVYQGSISGITNGVFADIDGMEAYAILDGDDMLNGGAGEDLLFGGYGGSDRYYGGGGGDIFYVAAGTTPVSIAGTPNMTDTITVRDNTRDGSSTLNLRNTALSSINEIVINEGLVAQIKSSQIGAGAGVSPNAAIIGAFGAGLLFIGMDTKTLSLAGFTVTGGVEVAILGGNADETVTGSNGNDILTLGEGKDTGNGLGGDDTFNVVGTDSQFDTFDGGSGRDTLKVFLTTALTLNGFNAASQAIEVWEGNGQSLLGNGNGNIFNLAGLTGMTGLPFVEGLGGNDTMTGSKFVDHLLGGDGDDAMSAGAGDDELEGGLGADIMTGGLGSDRFDFDAVAEIGKKKGLLDVITDWGDGDTIDLSSIDANGAKTGDKSWKFLKKEGADFTKAGQVGFDQKKALTYVQGDSDGDGKADFKLEVTGKIDFEKADFVL